LPSQQVFVSGYGALSIVTLGQVHFAVAIAVLVTGAAVVALRRGTGPHRLIGFVYALSMFSATGAALLIYNLTGEFGPFHVLALISLITLIAGTTPVLLRRPSGGWIDLHAHFLSWSYVGLAAAAAAETLTRLPEAPFRWAVVAASGVVIAIGAWLIPRSAPKILAEQFPTRTRQTRT
jgi:uncharacterized membrane protein